MSDLADFDSLLKKLDESETPKKPADAVEETEEAVPKEKPAEPLAPKTQAYPAPVPSPVPSPVAKKPEEDKSLAEFDAMLGGLDKTQPESEAVAPIFETLHQTGFKKMTPELAEIAKQETDPERIKEYPAWFEKSPEQMEIMYEYYKNKPTMQSLEEAGSSALQNLPTLAKDFAKGGGQFLEAMLAGEVHPYGETPEQRTKREEEQRTKQIQAVKAVGGAVGMTVEGIMRSGVGMVENGLPFINSIQTKLPEWTHLNISEAEAKKRYLDRERWKTYIAQYDDEHPDYFARLIDQTRPVTQNAVNAVVSHLTGSVDAIMAENPEMNREEAAKYKEEKDAALTEDYLKRSIDYMNRTKPTPEMETFAMFTVPLGNEFAAAGKTFDLIKKTAKFTKGIVKGAEKVDEVQKTFTKLQAASEQAAKQGAVGKAAGVVADKIQSAGEKLERGLEKLPAPVREALTERLPLRTIALGGAAGAATDDEMGYGFLKGALGAAGLKYGAKGLLLAPRVVSDLSKAKALAAGGTQDMFSAAMQMPDVSKATKFVAKPLSQKVPFANEAIGRWVGDRIQNHIKDAVHTTALTAALGIYDGQNADEMGRTLAEGLLIQYPHSYFNSMMGRNPRNVERNNRRQDFENMKAYRAMPEADKANIDQIASWQNVIDHSRSELEKATARYSLIPENQRNTPDALALAKDVSRLKAESEQAQRANPETRSAYAREVLASIANNQNLVNGAIFPNQNVQIRVMNTQQIVDQLLSTDPATGLQRNPNIDREAALAFANNAGSYFNSNGQVVLPNGKVVGKPTTGAFFDPLKNTVVINTDKVKSKSDSTGKKFMWSLNHEIDHALSAFSEYRNLTQPLRDQFFGKRYLDADGVTIRSTNGIYDEPSLVERYVNNYLKNRTYKEKVDFSQKTGLWDYEKNNLNPEAVAKYMQNEILAEARSAGLFGHTRLNSARQNLADWALVSYENSLLARTLKPFVDPGQSVASRLLGVNFTPEQLAQVRRNQIAMERFNGVMTPHDGSDLAPAVKPSDIKNDRVLADHYAKDDGVFKTTKLAEVVDKDGNIISTHALGDPYTYEGEWRSGPDGVVKTKGFGELPKEVEKLTIPEGGAIRVTKHIVYGADGKPVQERKDIRKAQSEQAKQKQRNILLDKSLLDPDNPTLGMRPTNAEGTAFRGVPTNKQLEAIFALPENILPYSIKEKIAIAVGLINDGEGTPTIGTYSARLNSRGNYEPFSPKIHEGVQIGLQFSKTGNWLFTEFNKSGARDKANLLLKYQPELMKNWNYDVDAFMEDLSKYMKNWKVTPEIGGVQLDPLSEQAARMRHANLDADINKAMEKRYIFDAFLNVTNQDAQGRQNPNPIKIDLPKIPKRKMTAAEKDDAKRSDPNSMIRSRRVDAYSDLKPSAGTKMPIDYEKSLFNAIPEVEVPDEGATRRPREERGPIGKGIEAVLIPSKAPKEEIVSATYTDPKTGRVSEGASHMEANPKAPVEMTDRESPYYGFKTSTGRVVSREEAYKLAKDSGQLKQPTDPDAVFNAERGVLHSNMVDMPVSARQVGENIEFAKPPSEREAVEALSSNKRSFFGSHRTLEDGYPVGLRIDIPAYNSKGVYVVTVHEKKTGGERGQVGERIGYDTIAKIDNPVFFSNEIGAGKIKSGETNKFPVATVEGEFNSSREIPSDINEWTPVGYNPKEHSYFYDKRNDEPVLSGDEAISVGNTVFVKNPVYGNKANFAFTPEVEVPSSKPFEEQKPEKFVFSLTTVSDRVKLVDDLVKKKDWKAIRDLNQASIRHVFSDMPKLNYQIKDVMGAFEDSREVSASVEVQPKDAQELGEVRKRMVALGELWKQTEVLEEQVGRGDQALLGTIDNDGYMHIGKFELEFDKLTDKMAENARKASGIQAMTIDGNKVIFYDTDINPAEFDRRVRGFRDFVTSNGGILQDWKIDSSRVRSYRDPNSPKEGSLYYNEDSVRLYGGETPDRLRSPIYRVVSELLGRPLPPPKDGRASYFVASDVTPAQVKLQNKIGNTQERVVVNDKNNKDVERAYNELNDEVLKQYDALVASGMEFTSVKDYDQHNEIYKNSADVIADIRNNNRLTYLLTSPSTFGPTIDGKPLDFSFHPLLKDSGRVDASGNKMTFNDVFRCVHDAIAHGIFSTQFGPVGEESAWNTHIRTIDNPWARWALTMETRAQNSWVNYRDSRIDPKTKMPYKPVDKKFVPISQRDFALQKYALVPLKYALTGDSKVDAPVKKLMQEIGADRAQGSKEKPPEWMPSPQKQKEILAKVKQPPGTPKQLYTEAKDFLGKPTKKDQADSMPVMAEKQWVEKKAKKGDEEEGSELEEVVVGSAALKDVIADEITGMPLVVQPLPNYRAENAKSKVAKAVLNIAKDPVKYKAYTDRVVAASDKILKDPERFTTLSGFLEYMRDSGASGDMLMPPSQLVQLVKKPTDIIDLWSGGYHGNKTIPGTVEAAKSGLDGVNEMRSLFTDPATGQNMGPTPMLAALHHFWGILSRQLDPLNQEGMWMRLVSDPKIMEQIQNSIDGKYDLSKEQWVKLVAASRKETRGDYQKIGNNAASNANAYHAMLHLHNGKWQELANIYKTNDPVKMTNDFWGLGVGATGIKNKVQRFIGLTFGIHGSVLDRWRFVSLNLPMAMKLRNSATPDSFFNYYGKNKTIPEDPVGIYKVYGTLENGNPVYSTALYAGIDRAIQGVINNSPEMKKFLGVHATPGGFHWVDWNCVKNEAVGHSSLDLTKEFYKQKGRNGTAQDFLDVVGKSKVYTRADQDGKILDLVMDKGVFRVETK